MAEEQPITLSREQLRFIELLVARNDQGVTSIDVADAGRGALRVSMFDKSGFEVGTHTVKPTDNELPY